MDEMELREEIEDVVHKHSHGLGCEIACHVGSDQCDNCMFLVDDLIHAIRPLIREVGQYNAWYMLFKRKCDELQAELETYRPTKHEGNGLTKCDRCHEVTWDSWCYTYKGQNLCGHCLKNVLSSERNG